MINPAKYFTSKAKTMISPYGTWYATLDNLLQKLIHMLNVDIIVYQDEMGCARENPPQKNMRNNFSKLVKIHEGTRINI